MKTIKCNQNPTIEIIIKSDHLYASRLITEEVYKVLDEKAHIQVIKEPFYLEKDASDRHCYVFDIELYEVKEL